MYYTHTSLVHIQSIKQTTGNMMRRPGTSPAGASRHHSASLPNLLLTKRSRETKQKLRGLISSPQTLISSPVINKNKRINNKLKQSPLLNKRPNKNQIKNTKDRNAKLPPHLVDSAERFVNFLQTDWKRELNIRPRKSTLLSKKRSEVKRAAKRLVDGTADFMEIQIESFKNYMSNEWPGVKALIGEP